MINRTHFPRYHARPDANWINDPNGLIRHDDVYHLFYQHNPEGALWGNMTWGHMTSRDLVTWKEHPLALTPAPKTYDAYGVYSGTVAIIEGTPYAFYTGVCLADDGETQIQTQCVAKGDATLTTWEKLAANPVIVTPPKGVLACDFRDPFIFKENGTFHMLVGARHDEGHTSVLHYRANSPVDWEYVGTLYETPLDEQTMYECPNFFPVDDETYALLYSPYAAPCYKLGRYENGRFTANVTRPVGAGAFYASLLFSDSDGRRLMFSWIREQRPDAAQEREGWSGAFSLPVEVGYKKGALTFTPAREVAALREDAYVRNGIRVQGEHALPQGDALEFVITLSEITASEAGVVIRRSHTTGEETRVGVNRIKGEVFIDTRKSSTSSHVGKHRIAQPILSSETVTLRVFVDVSIIEVFVNARILLVARIYPTADDAVETCLYAEEGVVCANVEAYRMRSVNCDTS